MERMISEHDQTNLTIDKKLISDYETEKNLEEENINKIKTTEATDNNMMIRKRVNANAPTLERSPRFARLRSCVYKCIYKIKFPNIELE